MYYNGRWNEMCGDNWSDAYATLVCRVLGFGSSGRAPSYTPIAYLYGLKILTCSGYFTFSCTFVYSKCSSERTTAIVCNHKNRRKL